MPSLLTALQNEYDAVMLEMLSLKKQYDSLRQDLAHALYTNDASTRVIARLMKERDEAREALASVHNTLGTEPAAANGPGGQDVDMAPPAPEASAAALPADVAANVDALAARLSGERRAKTKRAAPQGYTTPATASSLGEAHVVPSLHNASSPGLTCLAVSANGQLAASGGNDKNVVVYDRASDKVLATLRGHTKRVTSVAFSGVANPVLGADAEAAPAPTFLVSGSEDGTVRVWRLQESGCYALAHLLKGFRAGVTGVAVHPNDALVGSASRDGSWALHALESGERILHVTAGAPDEGGYAYESFAFHPDGQLAATGTGEGAIRVWDVKQGLQSAVFRGHEGAVHTLDFSQNGYLLVAGSRGSSEVKVWDLRKLAVTRVVRASEETQPDAVQGVRIDPTAQLLAVVGLDVKVFTGKAWDHAYTYDGNAGTVTDAQWSPVDGALLLSGLDRTLRVLRTQG